MFYCILANGLNFERNPRRVIRTEQSNFVWLGIGMWTLTYEELHVSVTAADNVFYPCRSLRVGPRTLLVTAPDGDAFSHSLNILRSSYSCAAAFFGIFIPMGRTSSQKDFPQANSSSDIPSERACSHVRSRNSARTAGGVTFTSQRISLCSSLIVAAPSFVLVSHDRHPKRITIIKMHDGKRCVRSWNVNRPIGTIEPRKTFMLAHLDRTRV